MGMAHYDVKPGNVLYRGAVECPSAFCLGDLGGITPVDSTTGAAVARTFTGAYADPLFLDTATGRAARCADMWALACSVAELLLGPHCFSLLRLHTEVS
jgi:hypothetical protein